MSVCLAGCGVRGAGLPIHPLAVRPTGPSPVCRKERGSIVKSAEFVATYGRVGRDSRARRGVPCDLRLGIRNAHRHVHVPASTLPTEGS